MPNIFSSDHSGQMNLSACDKEEIRFPKAIMPHGAILVLDSKSFKPLAASVNLPALLNENARFQIPPIGLISCRINFGMT